MAGAMLRIPMSSRILTWSHAGIDYSKDPAMTLSDTVFGFLEEEGQGSSESSSSSDGNGENEDFNEDQEREKCENIEDNKRFWETQNQLLQGTLRRTSSLESGIRNATKEAIKEIKMADNVCVCSRPVANGCRNCHLREVCSRLQNAGFNTAVCKSKWRSSPDIPSGEHTFLEVVDNSNLKKGELRVIIELNFRAGFEMARANEEYNRLINRVPEIFVGKVERLLSLIKILCSSAKKCMKENKMHMAPWRKQKYMQAKWLRICEKTTVSTLTLSAGYSGRPVRPRASMLTMDLLENFSNSHHAAVEVV